MYEKEFKEKMALLEQGFQMVIESKLLELKARLIRATQDALMDEGFSEEESIQLLVAVPGLIEFPSIS